MLGDSNHEKKDPDYVGTCDHTSKYDTVLSSTLLDTTTPPSPVNGRVTAAELVVNK